MISSFSPSGLRHRYAMPPRGVPACSYEQAGTPKPVLVYRQSQATPKIFFTKKCKKGLQPLLNAFTIENAKLIITLLFIESGYY